MEKNSLTYFEEKFNKLQSSDNGSALGELRKSGFDTFTQAGIPNYKNEEWKYTKISSLFDKEYDLGEAKESTSISAADVDAVRLPGHENANELVFVNGKFAPELSTVRSSSKQLAIIPLEEAATGVHKELVAEHLNRSSLFIKDGIHALNTSFIYGGVFIYVAKNQMLEEPVFMYHIADARKNHTLLQPRSLVFVDKNAKLQLVENYTTLGTMESFTNEVIEVVVDTDAIFEYYKIQNDLANASQVGTTHIRQIGKSYVHTFTLSLDGATIRNNIDIIMEAAANEAHMYGLYLLKGKTHVDNHTLVDNTLPNCFSNEFYKGVIDDHANGVFAGKIYVRPDAQKTNAYQSNKNILLSDNATVNTKPQLEIFADDVKCSHGCTVGQLDEEALFYLRTRGLATEQATSMLLLAFAADIVEQVRLEPLRNYVEQLITDRLSVN